MLFGPAAPDGLLYHADFVTREVERALVARFATLDFASVEMRGVVARRRVVHYGWSYGYYSRRTEPGPPLPEYLLPLRSRAGAWAGVEPEEFVEALLTEYSPGAAIGWHRDAPMFGDAIAGISLLAAARMKFRPCVSPADATAGHPPRRTTHQVELAPRSAYLIAGAARRDFERR
jgi:alkylated DNA repair dioxygenase AlkB